MTDKRPFSMRLLLCLAVMSALPLLVAADDGSYPDLRDSHDPELQAQLDAALEDLPHFWEGVRQQALSVVLADVTDLKRPKVAWYNPDLMLYAASMPKIAIAFAAVVEVDRGVLELDDSLRQQLVQMIKYSSNSAATAVLEKVGMERLQEILQDPQHGKLYDPDYEGGLWVGKPYSSQPATSRDPLKNLSHAASAMAAARFYYGVMTGELIDHK